jgi:hypothetical protein
MPDMPPAAAATPEKSPEPSTVAKSLRVSAGDMAHTPVGFAAGPRKRSAFYPQILLKTQLFRPYT